MTTIRSIANEPAQHLKANNAAWADVMNEALAKLHHTDRLDAPIVSGSIRDTRAKVLTMLAEIAKNHGNQAAVENKGQYSYIQAAIQKCAA